MHYMFLPLKRYLDFSGRSRRKEYWLWVLFVIIGYIVAMTLDVQLGLGGSATSSSEYGDGGASASFNVNGGILTIIFALLVLIPGIAVSVRRMHDLDKSGWMVLLALVPLVNFYYLYLLVQPGTPGSNRFGPDPKGAEADAQTFS
jgi:uncharacterized membrane protein YhaH (DUF805 family)